MKFEQLIQIYWARGFFVGGETFPFSTNFKNFTNNKVGINKNFKTSFFKRFEFNEFIFDKNKTLPTFDSDEKKFLNMFISCTLNSNNSIFELIRYNLIRIFLIKTFRGRCAALSKPARGQRTRSNASTSYRQSQTIKHFLHQVRKNNKIEKKPEILNKKLLRFKKKITPPKIKLVFTKIQKNNWF